MQLDPRVHIFGPGTITWSGLGSNRSRYLIVVLFRATTFWRYKEGTSRLTQPEIPSTARPLSSQLEKDISGQPPIRSEGMNNPENAT